jgi:thymidylate synthase (FAD)
MQVEMIAWTGWNWTFTGVPEWDTDAPTEAEMLVEFAGRNCYQSWTNPGKKTNAEYIRNIIEHGHGSVLEHASATFFITEVSRSLSHELIRHRHLSFSELSQRFVNVEDAEFVVPPLFQKAFDADGTECDKEWIAGVRFEYRQDVEYLTARFPEATRKQVREAARCSLPNCTETKIVVTGNFRAWRGFIDARANEHADAEICALAVEICKQLKERFPNAFQDYTIENGFAYTHWRKV